ncbi:MAG: TAXI family TRAP transporter solute-binding subunit [Candidatus Tectomicrobia bacterium]|nr:TAXI family TRAP transporter solute-binding subunit [Candidatus Tectomicrobia bacterium]
MSRRIVCLVLTALTVALGAAGTGDAVTRLKWGSTSVRSGLYANTVAMAGVVNRAYPGNVQITVVETGGYVENLVRLQKGSIALGPADAAAGYASYKGILDFQGRPHADLRSLWGGYITPIHILASKKSGVTTLQGLNRLSLAMNPGTTSGRLMEFFFQALDIKPKYKLMGLGASPDALKSGVVQGWYKAGYKDAAILDVEAAMDINIIPVGFEDIKKMNQKFPGQGKALTVPAGLFKALKQDQLSFAYVITDFVRKDTPGDAVYKIVKAVWENRKAIVGSLTTLRAGKFERLFENAVEHDLGVPFHAGAVRFYEEVLRVKVPAHLRPPEM